MERDDEKRKGVLRIDWHLAGCMLSGTPASAEEYADTHTDIFPPYQVREGEELGRDLGAHWTAYSRTPAPSHTVIRVMRGSGAFTSKPQGKADGLFSPHKHATR